MEGDMEGLKSHICKKVEFVFILILCIERE